MSSMLICRICGSRFETERLLLPHELENPVCSRCIQTLQDASAPPEPSFHWADASTQSQVGDNPDQRQTRSESANREEVPSRHPEIEMPKIQGYRALSVLGKGGMGVVFMAEQEKANRRLVAIKMLLTRRGWDNRHDHRFDQEVRAVSSLEHPNIVRIYEVGETQDQRFFTMEYCSGGTLHDRLKQGLMAPRIAAQTIATLARALEVVHQHKIVHRDLKPLNILYDATGAPKISDFGLAKDIELNSMETETGSVMGTLGYMSPEQASGQGNRSTPETDIYALGAILYSCLTGRVPFAGSTVPDTLQQIQKDDPVPVRKLVPKTPRDLETICDKCLKKEPTQRYRSAADLAEDLERYLDGRPILARPVPWLESLWKATKRRPALAALSLVVLLSGVGAIAGSILLFLANQHANRQRAVAEMNATLADHAAARSRRFSEFLLHSLGETDPFTKYFPVQVGSVEHPLSGTKDLVTSPEFLLRLKSHALRDFDTYPHERAKVLLVISNALRSLGKFLDAGQALSEAKLAFEEAKETTAADRVRWRFSQGCLFHEIGQLEQADKVLSEVVADPDSPLTAVELADTKLRLAWLCGDRSVLPGHLHSPSRQELRKRITNELSDAITLYRSSDSQHKSVKISICELVVRLSGDHHTELGTLETIRLISTIPHRDSVLQGYLLFVESENLRIQGKYTESIQKLEQMEQLASRMLGPESLFRGLCLGAIAAIELRAYECYRDPTLKNQYFSSAEKHIQQAFAIGRKIAPLHPRLAEGMLKLAQLYRNQKRISESIQLLKEAREIARHHPIDLRGMEEEIEILLNSMPKG